MATKILAKKLAKLAFIKKAHKITLIDLRKISDVTDFFIICSGDSDTQVRAIANSIMEEVKKLNISSYHFEGFENAEWIIIDFVDIVFHVFQNKTREFFNLEKIWGEAKQDILQEKISKKTKRK